MQGEQPEGLRLVRHQHAEQLRQPDRLGAQVVADVGVACRCGVALVEDEVEDRAGPRGAGRAGGGPAARGTGSRPSGSSAWPGRAAEPCAGSATRNARAISVVVSPPTSRRVSATCASAARAGWQQVKTSASRSSGIVVTSSSCREGPPAGRATRLAGEGAVAPDAVDRTVPRGRDDPGPGFVGRPSRGQRSSAVAKAS